MTHVLSQCSDAKHIKRVVCHAVRVYSVLYRAEDVVGPSLRPFSWEILCLDQGTHVARNAKIRQLPGVAHLENVLRLDVGVYDALFYQMLYC